MKEKINPLVEEILRDDKLARDDYIRLYLRVGEKLGKFTFFEVSELYRTLKKLPCFTTIERARRRVVSQNPELEWKNKKRNQKLENAYRSVKGNVDKLPDLYFWQ